jgi:hypothetical protein
MNDKLGKVLRTIAIILMGLTAAMNILGGAGTSCAAFFTKKYPPMWALYDYRWLYQALVITTVPLGIAGVWATIALVRGRRRAYRNTLIILVIGTILGAIQMYASLALRGKAVPANVKLYINAITLLAFLLFRLPGIRDRVDFESGDGADKTTAGGLSAIVAGCVLLSTAAWAGPSHTYQGTNWVHLFQTPLDIGGALLLAGGIGLLARVALDIVRQEISRADKSPAEAEGAPF